MTAEFAALVPAVLLVLGLCLGAAQVVGQQVRLTDAAADGARSLARGDGEGAAASRVRASVGAASMSTVHEGELVCVRLSAPASFLPAAVAGVDVAARGCALEGGRGCALEGGR